MKGTVWIAFDLKKKMTIEQAVQFDVSLSVIGYPTESEFQYVLMTFPHVGLDH